MTIEPGTRLGPYKIADPIGAGGMGEVYKAKDTRLDRTVAIKVLPEHLSKDPERRERFEREARAVSSLNHPHICTLHEFDTDDGIDYIVMEYIEGETLADRLQKGPLSLEQALEYGIQIVDGLDKAHRHGVVHRDLKPGNVMLTKPGVKLLDFGLAKFQEVATVLKDSEKPTQQKPLTDAGTIMGTVQYMAPEQLEGKEADARTDLFAFGAVLYEMLTGRKAFEGESQASLITAIMSSEPAPVSELQSMSPAALDRVVKKCLVKDAGGRWQTARDLEDELKWIANESGPEIATSPRTRRTLPLVLASVALTAIVAGLASWVLESEVTPSVKRFDVVPPSNELLRSQLLAVALSADGARIAYATTRQLYLRSTDAVTATAIPSSGDGCCPFFSPDGEWIGFFTSTELKKVSVRGGTPVSVAQVLNGAKGTWGPDGDIVFGRTDGSGIFRVPASGGTIEAITARTVNEFAHDWPELLPGGEAILFSIRLSGAPEGHIVVQSLATGERKLLIEEGSNPYYAPTGHLVFVRAATLLATPFNLDRLEVTGEPFPVVEGVMMLGRAAAQFNFSDEGTLVYAAGAPASRRMLWVNRTGRSTPAVETRDAFTFPRISPDGTRVAMSAHPVGGTHDIWIFDVDRGTRSRLTTSSHNNTPVWTPDGTRIAFASRRAGSDDVYWKPVDASAEPAPLLIAKDDQFPTSWHPDGSVLAYETSVAATRRDIWLLPSDGDRDPLAWLATAADEFGAVFSPNGRFVAYVSNVTGREEVYVGAYPEVRAKTVISIGGGKEPVWSPDGRELFYRSLDGNSMLAVAVRSGPEFSAGKTEVVFEGRYYTSPIGRTPSYDVSRDGQQFLMIEDEQPAATEFHVVLNWFEELKRLAPTE